ncbi:MAG: hypothetical protein E6Q76_01085, partial [Rhizobium sp.]
MKPSEYEAWVAGHCEATAANAEAAAALLSEPVRRYFREQLATAGEMGECTYRLVAGSRVPRFAAEHSDAVAVELRGLRTERAQARRPGPAAMRAGAPVCGWCRDTGLVVVPHPACVEAPADGPPRLVAYQRDGIRYTGVVEVSVLCDRPGCEPGRRVRDAEGKSPKPRPTLTRYTGAFAGAFNPVELLARHHRAVAERCRRAGGAGGGEWAALVARIRARVARAQGEAA